MGFDLLRPDLFLTPLWNFSWSVLGMVSSVIMMWKLGWDGLEFTHGPKKYLPMQDLKNPFITSIAFKL